MNLQQWLGHIYTIHNKEIDLGLERIRQVASILDILSFACPVITVAGTNGKGSCVKTLDAITRQAGYRVASYTSPHLISFNERISINGKPVSDATLCNAFEQIEKARADISLSFFEFTTLAALLIFKNTPLDLIILEVGLGGRLDAVNIIDADLAVITTISLDHTDRLGNTRESIGFEKAGIMRAGKPAVCGDYAIPASIKNVAVHLGTALFILGTDYHFERHEHSWSWRNHDIHYTNLPLPKLELQNVATALQAISLIQHQLPISQDSIRSALTGLTLIGRLTIINEPIETILEVAHNPAGGEWLAQQLKQQHRNGRLLAVVAMLTDKDQKGTLYPLKDLIDEWFVAGLNVVRGGSADQLTNLLLSLGVVKIHQHQTVVEAYQAAKKIANLGDKVLVFGSFHTVGEVLSIYKEALN